MNNMNRTTACGALIALAAALPWSGCGGGKPSMASKSAAAYAEAKKKGIAVAAGEHGGHSAGKAAPAPAGHAAMEGMDHATMTSGGHSTMAGMEHHAMPGMEHGTMPAMKHGAMPGMQHGNVPMQGMTGMEHGVGMAGMHHAASANVALNVAAPRTSGAMASVQPPATLRSDDFDAPAPVSQSEAAKAAGKNSTEKDQR